MPACGVCGTSSVTVSGRIGFCDRCLIEKYDEIAEQVELVHAESRIPFDLPAAPPREAGGIRCGFCANSCTLNPGSAGYCGLRENENGVIIGGDANSGRASWYHDPLPTNCVADWVCPGGTSSGYPGFSHCNGPEKGYVNLAVFYRACSFNCLYCQNWHFRKDTAVKADVKAADLAAAAGSNTSCICFFGGDPGPQVEHALETARLAREADPDRIMRICWETNGSVNPDYLLKMIEVSIESGGCIKFDLKAWSPGIHKALCGIGNEAVIRNFETVASYIQERSEPPLLIASTLLTPGYAGPDEIGRLASFIAGLNPDIPYSLLGFHPCFYLADLPATSAEHARQAYERAVSTGLNRVHIGNVHLLGNEY